MCATLSLCLLLNVRDCYLNTPSPLPLFTTGQTDRQPHTFTTYLKTNLLFCLVFFISNTQFPGKILYFQLWITRFVVFLFCVPTLFVIHLSLLCSLFSCLPSLICCSNIFVHCIFHFSQTHTYLSFPFQVIGCTCPADLTIVKLCYL